MTYYMRNNEVPYEDIDDALTDYISSTEYKDLRHRTHMFYLSACFLILLLGTVLFLDVNGIFEIKEEEKKIKKKHHNPIINIRKIKSNTKYHKKRHKKVTDVLIVAFIAYILLFFMGYRSLKDRLHSMEKDRVLILKKSSFTRISWS